MGETPGGGKVRRWTPERTFKANHTAGMRAALKGCSWKGLDLRPSLNLGPSLQPPLTGTAVRHSAVGVGCGCWGFLITGTGSERLQGPSLSSTSTGPATEDHADLAVACREPWSPQAGEAGPGRQDAQGPARARGK